MARRTMRTKVAIGPPGRAFPDHGLDHGEGCAFLRYRNSPFSPPSSLAGSGAPPMAFSAISRSRRRTILFCSIILSTPAAGFARGGLFPRPPPGFFPRNHKGKIRKKDPPPKPPHTLAQK